MIKKLLKEVIDKVKPDDKLLEEIKKETDKIKKDIEKRIKKNKIKAEVFIGGSFAKGTMIKKSKYDIDVYIRFKDNKNIEKFSKLVDGDSIHGSRDYKRIERGRATWEVIPILKIGNPKDAENITDLSPFHVSYIKNKVNKNKRLAEEILLAKAFLYANEIYGAESYINGISGYGAELLICYYKSFIKMCKEISKSKNKIIIDAEKHYKNKNEILSMINEAKLQSPIILIDPTFKERNALAALSSETFLKFQEACNNFLKMPSLSFFDRKEFSEKDFRKTKGEFIKIEEKTDKQKGDIAGSKLNKFHRFIKREIERYFIVKKDEFVYDDNKKGQSYFILDKKKEIIVNGPPITSVDNVVAFRKKHKNCYIKDGKVFAKEKTKTFSEFFREFKDKNKISIKSMGIISVN